MCRNERFVIVHPDGFREPSSRLYLCERGTPNNPCDRTFTIDTRPVFAGPAVPPPPPPPPPPPRPRETRAGGRPRRKEFPANPRLIFEIPNPFTSRKEKKSKPKSVFVRPHRGGQQRPEPEQGPHHCSIPQPQAPNFTPPTNPPIVQVPIHPPTGGMHHHPDEPEEWQPNGQPQRLRPRTLSPPGRYEEHKRAQLEREREAWEAALARQRQEADLLREQRDEARRRNIELDRERRHLAREANREERRQALRDAERESQEERRRVRREAEQERLQAEMEEEQRRRGQVQREAERDERVQAVREVERRRRAQREAERDERIQAVREVERRRFQAQREAEREERLAEREVEREGRRRRDQARREVEERARRVVEERARREVEEQVRREVDRIERSRTAGIPRQPRHRPEVHHYARGRGSLDARGEQVLDDARRARMEDRDGPDRGWPWRPSFGGPRRR